MKYIVTYENMGFITEFQVVKALRIETSFSRVRENQLSWLLMATLTIVMVALRIQKNVTMDMIFRRRAID